MPAQMKPAAESSRETNAGDFWLTVPQAVYLEATRDIETAVRLPERDANALVVNVMRRLSRVEIPDNKNWCRAEARDAAINALRPRRGRYNAFLGKLHGKLVAGLAVKGRREPDAPLEPIDPAEFTGLELAGVDAISRTTGEVVWHDLRISARAQVEILVRERQFEPWDRAGDQLPKLLAWAPTTCGGNLDELPGRDELLRLHRKQFGPVRGVNQHLMREVRNHLAPEQSRRGGVPTHRR